MLLTCFHAFKRMVQFRLSIDHFHSLFWFCSSQNIFFYGFRFYLLNRFQPLLDINICVCDLLTTVFVLNYLCGHVCVNPIVFGHGCSWVKPTVCGPICRMWGTICLCSQRRRRSLRSRGPSPDWPRCRQRCTGLKGTAVTLHTQREDHSKVPPKTSQQMKGMGNQQQLLF